VRRVSQALPCVIFLHGNSGCRVDAYDAVRVLLPLNITVFAVDLSGSGLSEGCVPHPRRPRSTGRARAPAPHSSDDHLRYTARARRADAAARRGTRDTTRPSPAGTVTFADLASNHRQYITLGLRESEDLRTVVSHLRQGGRVTKIGLWGRSMGAATSLFYGQKDPSVAALVLDSPFSKLTDLVHELVNVFGRERGLPPAPRQLVRGAVALMRYSIKRKAGFDISQLDVLAAASGSFVPALFGHATGDTFILPSHSAALYAAYPGDKNMITFDGTHNSARPAFFYDSVSIFFLNTLHPPDPPPVGVPRGVASAAETQQTPFMPAEMPPQPYCPAASPPSPELELLLQMGFPRGIAERALRKFRSVELASAWLVDHGEDGWAELMAESALGAAPSPQVALLPTTPGSPAQLPDAGAGAGVEHATPERSPVSGMRAFGDVDDEDAAAVDAALAAKLAQSLAAAAPPPRKDEPL
jgi:dienelactone hydrolase